MITQEDLIQITQQIPKSVWPFTGISTILFGMKAYARIWHYETTGWDDLILIISWVRFCHHLIDLFLYNHPFTYANFT